VPNRARTPRITRIVEKYLLNPLMTSALRAGIAPRTFALLETTGRHSGAPRHTPVGNGLAGSSFWLVAEHGLACDYVKNLVATPRVRVKVGREWQAGTAELQPDDDALARRRRIDEGNGPFGKVDGLVFRVAADDPLTVRIDLDP
jgi:deazaflavin-dependent oxidoreductase (nitroreductase family)